MGLGIVMGGDILSVKLQGHHQEVVFPGSLINVICKVAVKGHGSDLTLKIGNTSGPLQSYIWFLLSFPAVPGVAFF